MEGPSPNGKSQLAVPMPVVEYGTRRMLIVVAVMLASLLETLDSTIVNVALPTIEGNIGASIDEGIWIVTGYIISNVVAIPLAAGVLARFGIILSPAIGAVLMSVSTVIVAINAQLLRRARLE